MIILLDTFAVVCLIVLTVGRWGWTLYEVTETWTGRAGNAATR